MVAPAARPELISGLWSRWWNSCLWSKNPCDPFQVWSQDSELDRDAYFKKSIKPKLVISFIFFTSLVKDIPKCCTLLVISSLNSRTLELFLLELLLSRTMMQPVLDDPQKLIQQIHSFIWGVKSEDNMAQTVNHLCLLLINVTRIHWTSPISFSSLHFWGTFPLLLHLISTFQPATCFLTLFAHACNQLLIPTSPSSLLLVL